MRDAGRIGFDIKGEYDSAATYEFLDVVYYNYSSYVAKKETSGNPPVENNEYWQMLAKGEAGDYLPLSGGTLSGNKNPLLTLQRMGGNFTGLEYENLTGHLFTIEGYSAEDGTGKQLNVFARDWDKSLLRINENSRVIYDYKTQSEKEILVKGDSITPTVKETTLKTSTKELTVYGVNGSTLTEITDIFNKANTQNEGMKFGISPNNGIGYIQSQNFYLNCALLTEEERKLLQSFVSIQISKENNSNDYPRLKPDIFNFCTEMYINGKNGNKQYLTKCQIQSSDARNLFAYSLPADFRNDDFSKNVLTLRTNEWLVATGIDIKNRG